MVESAHRLEEDAAGEPPAANETTARIGEHPESAREVSEPRLDALSVGLFESTRLLENGGDGRDSIFDGSIERGTALEIVGFEDARQAETPLSASSTIDRAVVSCDDSTAESTEAEGCDSRDETARAFQDERCAIIAATLEETEGVNRFFASTDLDEENEGRSRSFEGFANDLEAAEVAGNAPDASAFVPFEECADDASDVVLDVFEPSESAFGAFKPLASSAFHKRFSRSRSVRGVCAFRFSSRRLPTVARGRAVRPNRPNVSARTLRDRLSLRSRHRRRSRLRSCRIERTRGPRRRFFPRAPPQVGGKRGWISSRNASASIPDEHTSGEDAARDQHHPEGVFVPDSLNGTHFGSTLSAREIPRGGESPDPA